MLELDAEFFDRLARMPIYWYQNSSPKLRNAVTKYLGLEALNKIEILSIKLYLEQFINATAWEITDEIIDLRCTVKEITRLKDIDNWIAAANAAGINPLQN